LSDAYNLSVGTCLSAAPLPPCTSCGMNDSFSFISLSNRSGSGAGATADVNLGGVKYGTATVIESNVSINEDLAGNAFGAFADGDDTEETLILEIEFCDPISVQQVDILCLETESQAWVGTALAGRIPTGLTFAQCGGPATMAATGNMVTNTSASCANQGSGNYTVGGVTTSLLYFRYTNPIGGCKFDLARFRIGTCLPDLIDATPTCPVTEFTVIDCEGNAAPNVVQDANGNFYSTCNDMTPNRVSPCFDFTPGELCPQCTPEPVCCDPCPAGESFEYVNFNNGTAFLGGREVGEADILFSDLDISTDLNGTTFGGFDNDGGTYTLELNFCPPLDICELEIINLEVESIVEIGTTLVGEPGANQAAALGGLDITRCSGSTRMDVEVNPVTGANNYVQTDGPGCGANPNAVYTINNAPAGGISTLYFQYHNPPGGCSFDYVGFRIATCVADPLPEVDPVCPIDLVSYDLECGCEQLFRDANGIYFEVNDVENADGSIIKQNIGSRSQIFDPNVGTVSTIFENVAIGECAPIPTCPLDLVETVTTELKTGDGLLTSVWTDASAFTVCNANGNSGGCGESYTIPFDGPADACGLPTHINGTANNEPFLANAFGYDDVAFGFGAGDTEQAQQDGWLVLNCDVDCVFFRLGGPRVESAALFAGAGCSSMDFIGEHIDNGPDVTFTYSVPDNLPNITVDGCCFQLLRVRVYSHDPGAFSSSIIQINTGSGYHNPFANELWSVPDHTSDVLPTLGTIENVETLARFTDINGDHYWNPNTGEYAAIDNSTCIEFGCVTENAQVCFEPRDFCGDRIREIPGNLFSPFITLNCQFETPTSLTCPVDLVELELMCVDNTSGYLQAFTWDGLQSVDENCDVSGGFREFNTVDCTPMHENEPTQIFKANTLGFSDGRTYPQPDGSSVIFAQDGVGLGGSFGTSDNPQLGDDDTFGEQGMQEGWIIFPKGVDNITFRIGGPKWDASQLWLGPDANSLALVGENTYAPGCSTDEPSTFVTYSTCSLPTVCGGQPYAALKLYHHDPSVLSSTLVAWSTDGKTFSGIPCEALSCEDPTTFSCMTTCETVYRDSNGDFYNATAKDGVFRAYTGDGTFQAVISSDVAVADCAPDEAPVEICGDGIDNDGDFKIDEGCPSVTLACPVDLVEFNRLEETRGNGMLTTQVWYNLDNFTLETNDDDLSTSDFFGCTPSAPECVLYTGRLGLVDNDPKSITGDQKMFNANGFIGNDGNAEAGQQDGWLILPCGVDCVDFRIGGPGISPFDVSALYLGSDVDNLDLVGEWNDYGQQNNQVFHYAPGSCSSCVAEGSIGGCTSTSTVLRLRFYHLDISFQSNTYVEWNYGCGWELIPAENLSSIPVEIESIPATTFDPVDRLLVTDIDSNEGRPSCEKTVVCDALYRDANGNFFELDGVTQKYLDPRFCETVGELIEENAECFGICVIDNCDGIDNDGDGMIDEDATASDNCELDCEATLYSAQEYFPVTSGNLLTTQFLEDAVTCCQTPATDQP